jgi:hypothetical protein
MVHNKILKAALLATLGLSSSGVAAEVWFKNIGNNAQETGPSGDILSSYTVNPATFTGEFETYATEKIVVNDVPTDGIIYAAEMFGSGGIDIPSSTTTGDLLAVAYKIDAAIEEDFDLTFTLSNGAKFADAMLSIDNANGTEHYDCTNAALCKESSLSSSVTYRIKPKDTDAGAVPLDANSVFALAYRLTDTGALATPGESIEMTITFETEIGVKVAAPRTLTVAKSAKALTEINILPEEIGTVKISVSSGQTQFTGENPQSLEGAYVSPEEAVLGYIEIKSSEPPPKAQDGISNWTLGANQGVVIEDNSLLTITEGQFAASASGLGRVYWEATGASEDATVTDVDGKWQAVWQLDDAALKAISDDTAADKKVPIKMKVDGVSEINVTENAPVATLDIDFENEDMQDIKGITGELNRFRLDGTVCTLYNIPGANAPDITNIRITNDTNATGTVTIGMWGQDGTELIASGTPLLSDGATGEDVLQPYASWHINAAELESLAGGPWEKRAIVTLSSTLSKLEVFALLRHKGTGINSNLSGGASGNACPDD